MRSKAHPDEAQYGAAAASPRDPFGPDPDAGPDEPLARPALRAALERLKVKKTVEDYGIAFPAMPEVVLSGQVVAEEDLETLVLVF